MSHKANALVTGVSRGLGLAVAQRLLDAGWNVCGVSRAESAEWRPLAARHAGRAQWLGCDLAATEDAVNAIATRWPAGEWPFHALVNNAATAYDDLVTNMHLAELQRMFAVNVLTPIALTRLVLRNMLLHSTRGAFVHVSSVTVHAGSKGLAMYAATKGALEAFSRNVAREWGERGIRSNCVVPGFMETEMSATLSAEQRDKIHRRAALRAATSVDSAAATVEFLLGDGAASITGQSIVVDAGMAV